MLRQITNLRGIASYVYCRTLINLEEPCRNLCVIHANVLPGSILTFEDTAQTVLVYPCDRLKIYWQHCFKCEEKRRQSWCIEPLAKL